MDSKKGSQTGSLGEGEAISRGSPPDVNQLLQLTREVLMLRCDNEKLAATGTKKGLVMRLAKFYGEKDNEQQPDGRGKRKRTDNLGKQVKNSQQQRAEENRKICGGKRKLTDNLSRNRILGDRKGHRLDEMDSEEEFVDRWGDEDGIDFNVSPGSERSRDSGEGVVEVDSPGDTSPDQATGGSSRRGCLGLGCSYRRGGGW